MFRSLLLGKEPSFIIGFIFVIDFITNADIVDYIAFPGGYAVSIFLVFIWRETIDIYSSPAPLAGRANELLRSKYYKMILGKNKRSNMKTCYLE